MEGSKYCTTALYTCMASSQWNALKLMHADLKIKLKLKFKNKPKQKELGVLLRW
jgi:hypothetical protein